MSRYEDLFGQKFGRLAPYAIESRNKSRVFLRCKCECGNDVVIRADHMTSGASRSCGCLQKEAASKANKKRTPFKIVGDVAIGKTDQGFEFIIDAEDLSKVSDRCWSVNANGYLQTNAYAEGKTLLLHKFIVGDYKKGFCVDHIDRNKLNNRKTNLRICLPKDNAKNTSIRIDNTSGFTGVYKSKDRSKWWAEITANGEKHYLGSFENFNDAVRARLDAEKEYFGEYSPHANANHPWATPAYEIDGVFFSVPRG